VSRSLRSRLNRLEAVRPEPGAHKVPADGLPRTGAGVVDWAALSSRPLVADSAGQATAAAHGVDWVALATRPPIMDPVEEAILALAASSEPRDRESCD
jgi:hypothetical protein